MTDDLEARVEELEGALRELRAERRRPPRGPFGLPRPPTPGEVLRAADEHAVPAAIASLEATIHALELLRLGLRAGRAGSGSETARRATGTRRRAERVGDAALERLDGALDDLADALEGEPTDPESRRLLSEAERLREEIDERVGETEGAEEPDGEGPEGPEVDVESELQSIKDEQDDAQTGSKR
jgi:hypothetical protein